MVPRLCDAALHTTRSNARARRLQYQAFSFRRHNVITLQEISLTSYSLLPFFLSAASSPLHAPSSPICKTLSTALPIKTFGHTDHV